jgi:signal transduction histidine kinase
MMKTLIELKNNQTALYHAARIAERTAEDEWDILKTLYQELILIHSSMGNQGKVAENLKKLNELTAKISDENLHNSLQDMEVKYEVAQKDLDLERQRAEIDRQRSRQYLYLGGLAAAGLLVVMLLYIVRFRTRRARLLAETNATKDKFFSIISHDLKDPAFAQRNDIRNLFENFRKWDADYISEYCGNLLKSANDNVELLQSLLSWSQTQTGRMTYQPVLFDLVAGLKSGIGVIQSMANEKEIRLDMQMPAPALITGDERMFDTVVRNLLVNAVKFTAHGGTVTLAVEPAAAGKYIVAVSDTGIGMSREQKQNLFRLDSAQSGTGTAGEQGSGLGLIVCKELLEKHGATLHVESEEGTGSRFWFEI